MDSHWHSALNKLSDSMPSTSNYSEIYKRKLRASSILNGDDDIANLLASRSRQERFKYDVYSTGSSSSLSIQNRDDYNTHLMASTSASSVQKSFKYDVFLSFRGEDTRKTFVDHLYHALDNKGIITYKDDEKIQKGERISEQLLISIEESRFYIIVFSKNYASSSWCLDELVKIMECQKKKEHTAYPIFYDVEPTEVRNQSGSVGEAFAKHEKGSWISLAKMVQLIERFTRKRKRTSEDVDLVKEDKVRRWRNAMKEAAGVAGLELKDTFNGHEAKFIQQIVQDISLKLRFINFTVDGKLVGMETRVMKVLSSLEICSEDVRVIGIKGLGGGGKTTLARAVFDHISVWFEGTSFVENVREVSKGSLFGLTKLQQQVLRDVLNEKGIDVTNVSNGKVMMKRMMGSRKVLVVLDDVDDIEQLEALAGELTWFKPGSRIIITTRDEQVLIAHRVNFIHHVNLLSDEEALCLFCRHAFEREIPIEGYEQLSEKVIHYAAGLPLTIKVLGSHLCGRSELVWADAIKRLKTIPLKETLKRLEISYDGLEDDQKEIFLDVVCLLKGFEKKRAIRILEICGFSAQIGLSVLEQKSLITISGGVYAWVRFHDHIEEMGWNIVRRLHPDEPSRHSRLWITKEIKDISVNESGTEATRSIRLHPAIIIKGLRFLMVHGWSKWVDVEEASQYLPDALRYLSWSGYPFCCLPNTFAANKLVNLRFLDLSYSKLKTFDLELTPHLEELNLQECKDFVELHLPFKCLNLKFLDLSGSMVNNLNLGMTPHLEQLNLQDCYCLQEIHVRVGCLKNIYNLKLSTDCLRFEYVEDKHKSGTTIRLTVEFCDTCRLHPHNNLPKFKFKCRYEESLPSWSANLEKIISYGGCTCSNLEAFLTSICGLQQLKQLTLEGSIPVALLSDLYQKESLESLILLMKEIKHLPDSIHMLTHLKSLKLGSCERLEQIHENICRLECLKSLDLTNCIVIEKLPEELGRLEGLENLDLTGCKSLRHIPNSICNMKCLKRLFMWDCILVEKLPEELGRLECLEELNLTGCKSLRDIPKSICNMNCLKSLFLIDCILIEKLPEELGCLKCLEELYITGCKSLRDIPKSICNMKGTKYLSI